MKITLPQLALSALAFALAAVVLGLYSLQAAAIGEQPLWLRALLVSAVTVAVLLSVYPFQPAFRSRMGSYLTIVCLPAAVPAFIYFLAILPTQAGTGVSAQQLGSALVSDSSSNGYVEVGFGYPIFTPALRLENRELFTRYVNVFLRVTESSGEASLYRAVREQVPGSGLSVESSVRGLLSEADGYLFLPLAVPPQRALGGRVVFVISSEDNGRSFLDTLARAQQAAFELRDPETGELLQSIALSMD
jgi:hypothetical protein